MKRLSLFAIALAATTLTVATAHAVKLNGKKGIGYTNTLNGTSGMAFNMGMGNLILEGTFSMHNVAPKDFDVADRKISLGLGAHFQALRADVAAFTVGGRLNIGNYQAAAPKSDGAPDAITEIGISIPTRVYWFPNKYISLHVETGIDIQMPPKEGNVYSSAPAEGTGLFLFSTSSSMGMTFWW